MDEDLFKYRDKKPEDEALTVPDEDTGIKDEGTEEKPKGFHLSLIGLIVLILCILFIICAVVAQTNNKKAGPAEEALLSSAENVVVEKNEVKNEIRIETAEEEIAMTENIISTNEVGNTTVEDSTTAIDNTTKEEISRDFYEKYINGKYLKEENGELIYTSPEMQGEIHMAFDKDEVLEKMYVIYDCGSEDNVETIKSTFAMFGYTNITSEGSLVKLEIPFEVDETDENSKITKSELKEAFENSDKLIDSMMEKMY